MRLKSGNAGDSFWLGTRIPVRIQSQSCAAGALVAFSRSVDPATGDSGDPKVIRNSAMFRTI
jgi:hypothetical protein